MFVMFHKHTNVLWLLKFSEGGAQIGHSLTSLVRAIWWLLEGNHKDLMQAAIPHQLDLKRITPILLIHDNIMGHLILNQMPAV